jgi:hypothetical protein
MIWIEVTEDDIRNGEPCDTERCPIARALYRATLVHFDVNKNRVMLLGGGGTWPLESAAAKRFIDLFDNDADVKPFAFQIRLPSLAELSALTSGCERSYIP